MDMIFTKKPIDNYILDFFYELMLGLKSMAHEFLKSWKGWSKGKPMNELGLLFWDLAMNRF
jgi:hypothetical protein